MTTETPTLYNKPENDTIPNQRRLLTGLLVGPVVYTVYFFAVYLGVEAACRENLLQFSLLGLAGLEVAVLGLTLVAVVMILAVALYLYRASQNRASQQREKRTESHDAQDNSRFVQKIGLWLSGFFVLVTLVTGVPILFLKLCSWV